MLGFQDEVWWSCFAQPHLHAWSVTGKPLRLIEQTLPTKDDTPKALACYGVLLRHCPLAAGDWQEETWLRFMDGRHISPITIQFLDWCCAKLQRIGKRVFILVWDNARWHISRAVQDWIRQHNRCVKQSGQGVRIFVCPLPTKNPWLNPIEPKWVHGKRRIVEPEHTLSPLEVEERVADITYIPTEEGWLYLAGVLDLYSRRIVGWDMAGQIDAKLVERALRMALYQRQPNPGLLHHSDRGSQYASHAIKDILAANHIQVSMSSKGDCYDNAVMESFFSP